MKFAILDAANLFNRAHHVCGGDAFTKSGMALHIIFNSIRKVFKDHKVDHIVIAGEGRSWRYDYYPQYKAKRILARSVLSAREKEEQDIFREALNQLMDFFAEKTRMTVLQMAGAEGDDFIARWIQLHPNDEHVIVSGDSDNIQLLAPNVSIYDGVTERLIRPDGIFNVKKEPMVFLVDSSSGKVKVKDSIKETAQTIRTQQTRILKEATVSEKRARALFEDNSNDENRRAMSAAQLEVTKAQNSLRETFEFTVEKDWPQKCLFLKIIRGDVGDGIFSANPGVRYKGSSKNVGIEDAWNDRHEQGYHWNNFMQKRWDKLVTVDGEEQVINVSVAEEYAVNEMLINLAKQPKEIVDMMDRTIIDAVQKEPVGNIGIHFARFCKLHQLNRLSENAGDHAEYMSAPYGGRE